MVYLDHHGDCLLRLDRSHDWGSFSSWFSLPGMAVLRWVCHLRLRHQSLYQGTFLHCWRKHRWGFLFRSPPVPTCSSPDGRTHENALEEDYKKKNDDYNRTQMSLSIAQTVHTQWQTSEQLKKTLKVSQIPVQWISHTQPTIPQIISLPNSSFLKFNVLPCNGR